MVIGRLSAAIVDPQLGNATDAAPVPAARLSFTIGRCLDTLDVVLRVRRNIPVPKIGQGGSR